MLRHVADQLRSKWPKLATLIDDSETEVLSYLDFPEPHRSKLHSTNPLERLNKEVKRRADAPSKAWMPNARPQCCCQAPQPRSGAPKAQGLIAARWPQHNRLCRRSLPADAPTANNISTGADGSVALQLQSRISTNLTDVTLTLPSAVAPADGVRSASGYATWDCCRHAIGFSTHEQSPYDPRRFC